MSVNGAEYCARCSQRAPCARCKYVRFAVAVEKLLQNGADGMQQTTAEASEAEKDAVLVHNALVMLSQLQELYTLHIEA